MTASPMILSTPKAAAGPNAAVYTQITDVENECNGLFTYDRVLNLRRNRILASNQKAITGLMTVTDAPAHAQTGVGLGNT